MRKPRSKPDGRLPADSAGRPLWVLLRGGRLMRVGDCGVFALADALYFCREGDPAWRPIAELMTEGDR